MFCIITELPSVKGSKTWLTVDDEARVESNNLVHVVVVVEVVDVDVDVV